MLPLVKLLTSAALFTVAGFCLFRLTGLSTHDVPWIRIGLAIFGAMSTGAGMHCLFALRA